MGLTNRLHWPLKALIYLYPLVHLGTNSKSSSKKTPKFRLIPADTKTHMYVEKIHSITDLYLNSFLYFFSIKITIKEEIAKNGGHLRPGNTLV